MRIRSVEELIGMIGIDVIGEIEAYHRMLREQYKVKKVRVDSYEEFVEEVVKYYQYHTCTMYNAPSPVPASIVRGNALAMFAFTPDPRIASAAEMLGGKEEGYKVAADNSIRGRHGGLIGAIDALSQAFAQKAIRKHIDAVFLEAINPRNYDLRVSFMVEYLRIYGAVLLQGQECLSPYLLAANWQAVIENHVKLVNEYRKFIQ